MIDTKLPQWFLNDRHFEQGYKVLNLKWGASSLVVICILPHAEFGRHDHRSPYFRSSMKVKFGTGKIEEANVELAIKMKLMVPKNDASILHFVLDVIKLNIFWLDQVVHGFWRSNQWFMEYHGSGLVFEPTSGPTVELNLEPILTHGTLFLISMTSTRWRWPLSIEQRWYIVVFEIDFHGTGW